MYSMTAAVNTRFGQVPFLAHFITKVAQIAYGSRQDAVWQCSSSQRRFAYRSRGIISTYLCVVSGLGNEHKHTVGAWAGLI